MFVEIHVIQNFAPSNLNRDDTGSPKDCEFGGHRRARVSSQCWKRAVREYFKDSSSKPAVGVRTKKLVSMIAEKLTNEEKHPRKEEALAVAMACVQALALGLDAQSKEQKKTSVLVFVGEDQVERLVGLCAANWEHMLEESQKKDGSLKDDLEKQLKGALQGSKALDLALFGRMIAEDPSQSVDAACQVAHAVSTHRVAPEFDYYTAVDDLGREDETGAGMLGTQEFNSACYYRYANVDLKQLEKNLGGDAETTREGVRAFLESFVRAIPKAKQNSSAAQSLPSFVMTVVRKKGLASLANAFVRPVNGNGHGLVVNSMEALGSYWNKLSELYGDEDVDWTYLTLEDGAPTGWKQEPVRKVKNLKELLDRTMTWAGGAQ